MNNTSFEQASIKKVSFRKYVNGVPTGAIVAGCTGSLDGETEIQTLSKNCGVEIINEVTKPIRMSLTMEMHLEKELAREMFSFNSKGLVAGIYSFNRDATPGEYVLVAEVNNLDGTDKKYIAFPRVKNIEGFSPNIDNSATELPYMELTLTALADKYGNFYYEGYESDIKDTGVKDDWLTAWTPELMQETEA